MIKRSIAIINESSVITDAQLAVMVAACQVQVARDFAPAWGVDAELFQVKKLETVSPGAWQIVIADDSDQAGALGYHDTTPEGLPLGKVFAKSDLDAGSIVSATLSHEILELLADPDISRLVQVESGNRAFVYALEVCDPCEDDRWNYEIAIPVSAEVRNTANSQSHPHKVGIRFADTDLNNVNGESLAYVAVSDFIYPRWFHSYRIGNVGAPTVKAEYQPYYQVKSDDDGWRVSCLQCGASHCGAIGGDIKEFRETMAGDRSVGHRPGCVAAAITPDDDEARLRNSKLQTPHSAQLFDQAGHMNAPFQILEGGYISVSEVTLSWRDQQQMPKSIDSLAQFAMSGGVPSEVPLSYRARPRVGSRRERRRAPREQWLKSKAVAF